MYPLDQSLITSLTLKRIVNAAKISASYSISLLSGRETHWGGPVFLSVEPTSLCNLRCPECPSGVGELNRRSGFMNLTAFREIIDSVKDKTLGLLLYFQGEPFLNKDIYSMISYARRAGMYVITSTNAHFFAKDEDAHQLIDSGLNSLIVSLDGITEETYRRYRVGGSLEKVLNGVEKIIRARTAAGARLPRVYFQFVVMSHNEHEIGEAKKLARQYGADKIFLKNVQIVHDKNFTLLPKEREYRQYEVKDEKLLLRGKVPDKCFRLWTGAVITWDGKQVPCCYDKTAAHGFGEVSGASSVHALLHSESARAFRQKVLDSRSSISLCAGCKEGRTGFLRQIKKALNIP